tara:strand:- start:1036 stop:1233 length:198 start_codon:yes stop_codon:yes gene_type:complete
MQSRKKKGIVMEMLDLGLKLLCAFGGLVMTYYGLFKWPSNKDPNIIDVEWEEINERENKRLDVFV